MNGIIWNIVVLQLAVQLVGFAVHAVILPITQTYISSPIINTCTIMLARVTLARFDVWNATRTQFTQRSLYNALRSLSTMNRLHLLPIRILYIILANRFLIKAAVFVRQIIAVTFSIAHQMLADTNIWRALEFVVSASRVVATFQWKICHRRICGI